MFFDFGNMNLDKPEKPTILDLEKMSSTIGELRRFLTFYNV
jgi:hypothetical protein